MVSARTSHAALAFLTLSGCSCGTDAVRAYTPTGDLLVTLHPATGHMTNFAGRVMGTYDNHVGLHKVTPEISLPMPTSWVRTPELFRCDWQQEGRFRCVHRWNDSICDGYVEPAGRWDGERYAIVAAACQPDIFFDLQQFSSRMSLEFDPPPEPDLPRDDVYLGGGSLMGPQVELGPYGDLWSGGIQCGQPLTWNRCLGTPLGRVEGDAVRLVSGELAQAVDDEVCGGFLCVDVDPVEKARTFVLLPTTCAGLFLVTREDPHAAATQVAIGHYLSTLPKDHPVWQWCE